MKVERKVKKPEFVPIVITLETQDEVNKLFALSNYVDLLDGIGLHPLFNGLSAFYDCEYIVYHDKLRALIHK